MSKPYRLNPSSRWCEANSFFFKLTVVICFMFRTLRAVLVVLVVVEYWYETREDRVLAAERTALLPR